MTALHRRASAALALATLIVAASTHPVLAHHAMGGETPDSLTAGLLSGIGHPIIGFDHLAFMIAVGLASAFTGARLLMPLAFVAATVAGCLLLVSGIALPATEVAVAASVVILGGIVLSGRSLGGGTLAGLFAVAGLAHGWAYGASIVGAESTPLLAYLVGFAAIQYAVAVGAGLVALRIWNANGPNALQPRLAGAIIAGAGLVYLTENLESLLLA